jgi:hypothetical protein
LLVKAWKDYDQALLSKSQSHVSSDKPDSGSTEVGEGELLALTIEMQSGNAIVLAIQPRLLLVLVGCNSTANEVGQTRFHAEPKGEARYPPLVNYPTAIHFLTDLEPDAAPLSAELVHSSGHVESSPARSSHTNGSNQQVSAEDFQSQLESELPDLTKGQSFQSGADSDDEPEQGMSTVAESFTEPGESLKILNFQRSKLDNMANMLRQTLRKSAFFVRE